MGDGRRFREPGDLLLLGGTEYRVEWVEGWGGSAVVYRASYGDELNRGLRHHVLIKELFPWSLKGDIYRNEAGEICCRGDGAERMENCRRNFYRGNEANLKLLEQLPEQIPGNINSYSAYGTFYSVLAVHGGESLEKKLKSGSGRTLKGTAETVLQILDALECFHGRGLLHLDISPDNILLLKGKALLIDYNSVWLIDGSETEQPFSVKEGYTAPEVRLRERQKIGPPADLYSVCAVWFDMLTGRRLSDAEIVGKRLFKNLSPSMEIFRGEPVTAVQKTVQILVKGLHVLAGKRWQLVGELRAEVEELILRIDGNGITHSALWEGSRRECRKLSVSETEELCRSVCMEGGAIFTREAFEEKLQSGGNFLLEGLGGMGKTWFLTKLWRNATAVYRRGEPVVVYLSLADYQTAGNEAFYIRKYLVGHLCFRGRSVDMDAALCELARQLDREDGWRLILLLDGLNEAGNAKKMLLKEIGELGGRSSVGILLTDRTDAAKAYGLRGFCAGTLLPLEEETIDRVLTGTGIGTAVSPELKALFGNPMMLFLYCRIREMSAEGKGAAEQTGGAADMDDLIGFYLEGLKERLKRADAGNETDGLRRQYLLCHFLPEIAREMKRRKKTLLTVQELCVLAGKNYRNLCRKDFCMAFPGYLGASRRMLDGFKDEMEWFDYAVTEQLEGELNLVRKSGGGNYCLIHENFIGYLAGRAAENGRVLSAYRRKAHRRGKCALLGVLLLLAGAGAVIRNVYAPYGFTGEERYRLNEVLYQLGRNIGTLGLQLDMQLQVLAEAGSKEVLEGDEAAVSDFEDWLVHKRDEADGHRFERSKKKDALEELERTGADVPFRLLEELLERTYEMDIIMEEGLAHLEEGLKRSTLSYSEREELVSFYRNYLEACAEVTCRELNLVLVCLDADAAEELLKVIGQTAVLKDYIGLCPYEGKSMEVLETELSAARARMRESRNDMKRRNYVIHVPDWQ